MPEEPSRPGGYTQEDKGSLGLGVSVRGKYSDRPLPGGYTSYEKIWVPYLAPVLDALILGHTEELKDGIRALDSSLARDLEAGRFGFSPHLNTLVPGARRAVLRPRVPIPLAGSPRG
jgi:hypothetical protein